MCLDKRLPGDTLFLVFEEDFRFFPIGEDPDGADDYGARMGKVIRKKSIAALCRPGPESLPPGNQTPAPAAGKTPKRVPDWIWPKSVTRGPDLGHFAPGPRRGSQNPEKLPKGSLIDLRGPERVFFDLWVPLSAPLSAPAGVLFLRQRTSAPRNCYFWIK